MTRATGRLSITHVIAPAEFGGLESVVALLAGRMAARRHAIRVVALLGPDGHSRPIQESARSGVEVIEVRLPARAYRAETARLTAELARNPGAIAHTHGYHADLVGLRAARRAGVPVVATAHGFTGGAPRNRVYEWLDRRALARFDAVVAVSRPLASRLQAGGVPPDRLHTIPSAFDAAVLPESRTDARRTLGLDGNGLVAGWVGRLSAEKGPDLFVEALALATDWQASVVGSGPMARALVERAAQLGIPPRLHWHGAIPDAGRLLAAYDAVVLSSRTEGTPIVLLEAMAAGVPLVVTAVGGIPDVVTEREAILVPPGSPERLARGLHAIRSEPEAARARAVAARQRLHAAYAVDPWLDRYESVYRSVGSATPLGETGS